MQLWRRWDQSCNCVWVPTTDFYFFIYLVYCTKSQKVALNVRLLLWLCSLFLAAEIFLFWTKIFPHVESFCRKRTACWWTAISSLVCVLKNKSCLSNASTWNFFMINRLITQDLAPGYFQVCIWLCLHEWGGKTGRGRAAGRETWASSSTRLH